MPDLKLKTDFPTFETKDWHALVEKGLRGAEFDSLERQTEDGIGRGPLMQAEDLPASLAALGRTDLPLLEGRAWHIAAPVRDPDLGHANTQLLEDLKGGASAIRIENDVSLSTPNSLRRVLEGVYTELVPLQFAHGPSNKDRLDTAISVERLQTSILWAGLDPFDNRDSIISHTGNVPEAWRLMSLSPATLHENGATDAQELAGLAAALVETMKQNSPETVCRHLVVDLAADCDTHLTIAKFRAARRIILRIGEAFGVDTSTIPLCAITSLRMMQTQDAWTNLLRIMSAGFGAVTGGADMLTTRPFTDGLGKATPFAHRIARNMQLLMMEESQIGHVTDAAHGSFWHENITEKLAQTAWQKFQSIEAGGGWLNYISSETLASDLDKSIHARAERNAPILGVTLHPATDVKTPEVRS